MAKKLIYNDEARRAIKAGVDKLADAVRVTMGPKGRNVVIGKEFGVPTIINDGVTIAKEITLEDPFENLGAQLVKEVASKASDVAGDGTTTATVLGQAIYEEGLRNVTAGVNPMALKRGMEKAVKSMVEELSKSKKIESKEEIAQVATISANNDPAIGGVIADAMEKVGKDGVITVEEATGIDTTVSTTEGMEFDQGYLSAWFVNNGTNMSVELDNPLIFLYDKKISSLEPLMPVLNLGLDQQKRPVVIVCEGVDGEALTGLLMNKARNILETVAIKSPGFGDRSREILEDLAVLTNGKLVSPDAGDTPDTMKPEYFGTARKVVVTKDKTTIIDGGGSKIEINNRVDQLKKQIDEAGSDYDKEKLQERLGKLSGGIAVLNVGASTEVEMKEKKARIDDALHATRAAVAEGILPGGGVALVRASKVLESIEGSEEELIGVDIIRRAISAPLKQIAENAGINGEVALERVLSTEGGIGLNAATGEYTDLVAAGVIDPAKVTRSALQNAASVAALMLTTECLIVEAKEEKAIDANASMSPF